MDFRQYNIFFREELVMRKKINPFFIGIFIVSAVLIFLAAGTVVLRGKFIKKSTPFVLYFNGSLNGLDIGSPVKFRGVRIGSVKNVNVSFDKNQGLASTPVVIEIDNAVFNQNSKKSFSHSEEREFYRKQILQGLSAKLAMESIVTGKLFVELDYYPASKVRIYGDNSMPYTQIPSISSEIQTILSIFKNISEINFQKISESLSSVLSSANEKICALDTATLNSHLSSILKKIDNLLTSPSVKSAIDGIQPTLVKFREFLSQASHSIEHLESDFHLITQKFQETCPKIDHVCDDVSSLLNPHSEVRKSTQNLILELTKTIQKIRHFIEMLEKNPNALLVGIKNEGN